jgi:hypothetical protein
VSRLGGRLGLAIVAVATAGCGSGGLAIAPPVPAAILVPVAHDDAYTLVGSGPLVVDAPGVLANDEGALLGRAILDHEPDAGTVILASNGAFEYTPKSGFRGTDEFRYRISTTLSESDHATVTITVIDPKPTPSPTPVPTPSPTPRPTPSPTPRPLPTVPLPTLPLPTTPPDPTATPRPTPTATPRPTPTADPTAEPTPSPTTVAATQGPSGPPLGGTGDGSGGSGAPPTPAPTQPPSTTFVVPIDDLVDPDRPMVVDASDIVFGGFEWQVPGLLLSVPGLLLILAVALQLVGGLAWLPVVRRRLGAFRIASRPPV